VTPPSLRTWGSGTGMAWRRRWTAASSAPRGWGCSRRYVHMLVQMRASSDSIAAIIVRDGGVCVYLSCVDFHRRFVPNPDEFFSFDNTYFVSR